MKNMIIGGVVLVLVIMGGGILFATMDKSTTNTQKVNSVTNTASSDKTSAADATITYSASGFDQAETTVKAGQTIKFTNNSSASIQVESDPHPQHTDDEDLNAGAVNAGQSKTITVTKKGTFGIHNHFNPNKTAKVTIQ
jgi:plastocyanin